MLTVFPTYTHINLQEQFKGITHFYWQQVITATTRICPCNYDSRTNQTRLLQHWNVQPWSFVITSGSEESELYSRNMLSAGLMTALNGNKVLQLQTCFAWHASCIYLPLACHSSQHLPNTKRPMVKCRPNNCGTLNSLLTALTVKWTLSRLTYWSNTNLKLQYDPGVIQQDHKILFW